MPEPSDKTDFTEECVSDSEDEVIELRRTPTEPPAPQSKSTTLSAMERKKEGLAKARAVLQGKREAKRAEDEKARKMIEKAYEAEMEEKLMRETIPKYSKQIKKQILERLKQKKLEELKKQYGYRSEESESETESESESEEEEEVVVKKKKKPVPRSAPLRSEVPVQKGKKEVPVKTQNETPQHQGILQRMKAYGF